MAGIPPIAAVRMPVATSTTGATNALAPAEATAGAVGPNGASDGGTGAQSFADTLDQALSELNGQLTASDQAMSSFASGTSSSDLGSLMLQMQEASLNLNLGVKVRDGLLDAYRQVMQLQV